ncbi:MAG: hypothetical protein CW341_01935 [Bacteroidetes bacterium]|nr:hypothetical protein [Bacteroidota bacterium]
MAKKQLQSVDGSLVVPYENVQNVCICVVIYPLLQYLLLNDLEICKHHTAYILDESISEKIRNKLPAYTFKAYSNKVWRKLVRAFQALTRDIRHPYLKKATIYAQDHDIVSILIGKHDYYLLSDGPFIITRYFAEGNGLRQRAVAKAHSLQGFIEQAIYGKPFVWRFGENEQCKRIYLAEKNDAPILRNKEVIVNSFQELWQQATAEKQQFILDVFDVTPEDCARLQSKPIVFFSQPMVGDQLLNDVEYVEVLQKIFDHYPHSELIIKTHPRDKFNYSKYFPDIDVFNKPVNLQLLSILSLSLKKAVTIFSTAVMDLPENVEIDWIGVDIHPKLLAFAGTDKVDLPRPFNKVNL